MNLYWAIVLGVTVSQLNLFQNHCWKHKMNMILAKHTGQSEETVEEATSYNHYFSPEESLEFGLVDEIVDFGKIMEEC